MKVLMLNSAPADRWGGAEMWMRRALELLPHMGHQALGLAPQGSPAIPAGTGRAWAGEVGGLRRALEELRPDVAVAVQHRDLRRLWWVARGGAVRLVMARHLDSARPGWRRRFYYAHLCHAVWAPSEFLRAQLAGMDRVPPGRIHVLRPSVPELPARPDPAGEPTLLCVGRLAAEKGHDVLLRARARMRAAARVVLVGGGREEPRLRALSGELGIGEHLEWIPYLEDLGPAFARAHLAVQPSRRESFGLAALEALARGVPVVGSRVGGLPEVVGEAGLLVPPDDPQALAEALDRGLADPALRARWAQAGVTRARTVFSPVEERRALQAALEGSVA
jgi:glycosyltransferase involved in cell wall biosynthesis